MERHWAFQSERDQVRGFGDKKLQATVITCSCSGDRRGNKSWYGSRVPRVKHGCDSSDLGPDPENTDKREEA